MLDEKRIQEIKERLEYVERNVCADEQDWSYRYEEDIEFLLETISDLRSAEQGGWIAEGYERGRKAGLRQAADYFKDVGHTTLASDLEKLAAAPKKENA